MPRFTIRPWRVRSLNFALCTYLESIFFTADSRHKYKNKEEDPRSPSTSRRSSSGNSTASRNKRTQKRTKPKAKRSRDGSKNSRTSLNESRNYKNKKCQASRSTSESSASTYSSRKLRTSTNTFGQVSGSSRDYRKQICTCRKGDGKKERGGTRSGNSHGHASPRSAPVERSKRRRKRSRRRRKKASKRESDRPRRDCFATLCVCVRGRSSDELRARKCASSREIPSRCESCSVKDGQEGTKRVTCRNALKNDTQVGRYSTGPSTSERKSALKRSRELSPAKPNEERSVIIKGLNTVRRGIDRFSARAIRLVTRQQ